jgi:thiol-disulfide isomerase/thioredoxin
MTRLLLAFCLAAPAALAQGGSGEQKELSAALAEAGNSTVDFLHVLEAHLEKYPESRQRVEIERAILKAAIETEDRRRILDYGRRSLARDPENAAVLEVVARLLLAEDERGNAEAAFEYARRLEKFVSSLPELEAGARGSARRRQEREALLAKSYVYQARAQGNLGKTGEAVQLARRGFAVLPVAETARELARWLHVQGDVEFAIEYLAEAFVLSGQGIEQQQDRERLGQWHRQWKGSEAGLGDVMLAAWDRVQVRNRQREAALRALDPNAGVEDPLEYTISGLDGEKLHLAKYRGKVLVLDFWATWCGPCRLQHPLYEQVKERFRNHENVVFLNISTDDNRAAVKPFLEENGWNKTIYFSDGLSSLLNVSSIPTTIVFNRRGKIASRMNGFLAERFVDMLSERIERALEER